MVIIFVEAFLTLICIIECAGDGSERGRSTDLPVLYVNIFSSWAWADSFCLIAFLDAEESDPFGSNCKQEFFLVNKE